MQLSFQLKINIKKNIMKERLRKYHVICLTMPFFI